MQQRSFYRSYAKPSPLLSRTLKCLQSKKVKNYNSNAGSGVGWRSSDKCDGTKGWGEGRGKVLVASYSSGVGK